MILTQSLDRFSFIGLLWLLPIHKIIQMVELTKRQNKDFPVIEIFYRLQDGIAHQQKKFWNICFLHALLTVSFPATNFFNTSLQAKLSQRTKTMAAGVVALHNQHSATECHNSHKHCQSPSTRLNINITYLVAHINSSYL